jgi:uncharacterized OB-fold protein
LESPRIQAAKQGQRKYTGKPCKACGETLRYTINSACVACTNRAKEKDASNIKTLLEQAERAGA